MTATPCRPYARTGLNNTIFPECRRIISQWNDYYGNCKWPDHASTCTWGGDTKSESSDRDISTRGRGGRGGRGGGKGGRGGASSSGRTKGGRLTQRGAMRKTPRGTSRVATLRVIT